MYHIWVFQLLGKRMRLIGHYFCPLYTTLPTIFHYLAFYSPAAAHMIRIGTIGTTGSVLTCSGLHIFDILTEIRTFIRKKDEDEPRHIKKSVSKYFNVSD